MVSTSQIPSEFVTTWDPLCQPATSHDKAASSVGMDSADPLRPNSHPARRLRSACDLCRLSRVKCSGGASCQRCKNNNLDCNYSVSMRSGRLKARRLTQPAKPDVSPSTKTIKTQKSEGLLGIGSDTPPTGGESITPSITKVGAKDSSSLLFDDLTVGGESELFMTGNMPDFDNVDPLLRGFAFDYPTSSDPNEMFATYEASIASNTLEPVLGASLKRARSELQPDLDFSLNSSGDSPRGQSITSVCNPATPLELHSLPEFASKPSCRCLTTLLFHVAELCSIEEETNAIGFDAILQMAREKSQHISKYLSCKVCCKRSANFIFPAIICQRLVKLFCPVARHGSVYLYSTRTSVGSFKLSEEEYVTHQKLLITSAAKHIGLVLDELHGNVKDYQQRELMLQKMGDLTTESGRSNLKWVFDSIRNLKFRLNEIVGRLEANDWGLKSD